MKSLKPAFVQCLSQDTTVRSKFLTRFPGRSRRTSRIIYNSAESNAGGFIDGKVSSQLWIDSWRARQGKAPLFGSNGAKEEERKERDEEHSSSQTPAMEPPAAEVEPSSPETDNQTSNFKSEVASYLQTWAGLGALYILDVGLKEGLKQAGISFPGPLVGMFLILASLLAMGEAAAEKVQNWFQPALQWIAKWLPLFYVASLVTLPVNIKGISGQELGSIVGIICVGMLATLIFTAQMAVTIRSLVKTENKEVTKARPASPFLPSHWIAWGGTAVLALVATIAQPSALGPAMALPFMLAMTLVGFLAGNAVPKTVQAVLHPVVITALVANASAALYGAIMGYSYDVAQTVYYSKSAASMGAGDVLMSFLGSVIISMGFFIYQQRNTMKRHAPEIIGATLLSSLFSFFTTALAAKALGLQAGLARAIIPRSVTVALALPIAGQLDAPGAVTAACCLVQGMLGANFGPSIMTALGYRDAISRGLAAAGTAGGLGTASLSSKEPETLPFCALSYSMVGIISTFLAATPCVRNAIIAIVG